MLTAEENEILDRCSKAKEEFRLIAYPESEFDARVAWVEDESRPGRKFLKITFKEDKVKHYFGIHFGLTLNCIPYVEKGVLEFCVKREKGAPFATNLNVYLKEASVIQRMVSISLPVMISKDWQQLSVPLNKFSLTEREGKDTDDEKFKWEIQEVLFSIDAISYKESVELFIDNLRIINEDKAIYELF